MSRRVARRMLSSVRRLGRGVLRWCRRCLAPRVPEIIAHTISVVLAAYLATVLLGLREIHVS